MLAEAWEQRALTAEVAEAGSAVEARQYDVRLVGLTKRFDDVVAVDAISLDVDRGQFFALLGPSGCGKTTTLRMIGGFEEPTEGRIELGGVDVARLPPYKRDVNTVFQSYALFPHLSIFENVAFGLRRLRVKSDDLRRRVGEALELVGLAGLERRKPRQLSGGQQQRIALARALVNRPRVLLLDEPLGALDLKLRKEMQLELKGIQHEVGITFVHVTHDQEEAMTMADRIVIMNSGRIEQVGTPSELYETPRTAFVAGFLGVSNLLEGEVLGEGTVKLSDGTIVRVPPEALTRSGHRPDRRPSGKDPDRRRRGKHALGCSDRERIHRSLDAVHPRHAGRPGDRVRAERSAWRPGRDRGATDAQLEPGKHFRRRRSGGRVMTDRMTRQAFVRRAAASGAALTVPGLLAACGGSGPSSSGSTAVADKLAKTLHFSNWTLYIDKKRQHASVARPVPEEVRRPRRLHRGHQRQQLVLGKIEPDSRTGRAPAVT